MTVRECALVLLATVLFTGTASSQEYPIRPIRLLVGFPPGGNVDVVGRIVAQKMAEGLGRSVVVENRPGAGSIIATPIRTSSRAGSGRLRYRRSNVRRCCRTFPP